MIFKNFKTFFSKTTTVSFDGELRKKVDIRFSQNNSDDSFRSYKTIWDFKCRKYYLSYQVIVGFNTNKYLFIWLYND